ncbi:glycosyltransferase family 4 protein [Microbacterium horticulturae]|uniref:D-inositol 3-phosphate glycosyltransferase n=1 Tax=Microbacterium horticulturae TaxID=3028316 RepID=A0ABY8C1F3_9MICO|nr:glycosyltransferase family 4 protein [Microbacterium sp. KACC 23027]WEG09187.1 glycosyltransferase family 4 protein [Microbacterium sp. KACC 23027]
MRIVLAASSYHPRIGGVEQHVASVAHALRRRGHTVAVWAVDRGDAEAHREDGIEVRYLPTPLPARSMRSAARFAAAAPGALRAWNRALRSDRPDVIDIQCFGPNGPWSLAAARIHSIPVIYSNHGETYMDADHVFAKSALLRRALRFAVQHTNVTTCSPHAGRDLAQFGATAQPTVVGNGILLDILREPVEHPLPPRFIAGVGRLVENKGFATLIRAFALAVSKNSVDGTELVIAGEGPEWEKLRQLASDLHIADRVHLIGPLRQGQVATLLDHAVVQVIPSRIEAFGIVALEGWRSATPLIATNGGGIADLIDDGVDGILFPPDDPASLTDALIRVLDDKPLRVRLAERGHQRVSSESFTWNHIAEAYEEVFIHALRSSNPRGRRLRRNW